jgi:hypothetical protein
VNPALGQQLRALRTNALDHADFGTKCERRQASGGGGHLL